MHNRSVKLIASGQVGEMPNNTTIIQLAGPTRLVAWLLAPGLPVYKFKLVSGFNVNKNQATAWHRQHSFTAER